MLGRKLGARMGLGASRLTEAGFNVLSISCPRYPAGPAGGAAGAGSGTVDGTRRGETGHRAWGSDLGTAAGRPGLGCSLYTVGSRPGPEAAREKGRMGVEPGSWAARGRGRSGI